MGMDTKSVTKTLATETPSHRVCKSLIRVFAKNTLSAQHIFHGKTASDDGNGAALFGLLAGFFDLVYDID